jgi:hypothetical protein
MTTSRGVPGPCLLQRSNLLYNVARLLTEEGGTHLNPTNPQRRELMYNLLQPVVDFTKANIETFSRFANSREVTELVPPQ